MINLPYLIIIVMGSGIVSKCKIAIIGGGASGLFVASLLSDSGAELTIYEKNNKLGKKILASGNGKCNFTNVENFNGKYNNKFAYEIISKFDVDKTLSIFSKLGLIYKSDNQGRCYPISETANSVLDCLKSKLNRTRILLEKTVEKIANEGNKIAIVCDNKKDIYDYVICCSGSSASNLGNEKAYSYLKEYNVNFSDIRASLVPVVVKEKVKELSGVRVKCVVKLIDDINNIVYFENGEVLFKDNGLSGIAIFNASSYINRNRSKKYKIVLDISSGLSEEELSIYFKSKSKETLFKGFLNDKLAEYISKKIGLEQYKFINEDILKKIILTLKNLDFNICDLYPVRDAQVCSGGVSLSEVTSQLCLKNNNNIYIAGELLDIDGVCGGYNLQYAWSSAGVIAEDIKRKLNEKE